MSIQCELLVCRLGLPKAAARVKRAIQFGSRLSKQTNVRDFGSNRAANIHKAGGLQLDAVAQGAFTPGVKWAAKAKQSKQDARQNSPTQADQVPS